jgi:hypothetical protein
LTTYLIAHVFAGLKDGVGLEPIYRRSAAAASSPRQAGNAPNTGTRLRRKYKPVQTGQSVAWTRRAEHACSGCSDDAVRPLIE